MEGKDVGALCWALVVGQGGTLNIETPRIWALLYRVGDGWGWGCARAGRIVVAPPSWHRWDFLFTQPKEEQSMQREGWKQQQNNSAMVYARALFAICIFFNLIHSPLCTAPYLTILAVIPECVPGGVIWYPWFECSHTTAIKPVKCKWNSVHQVFFPGLFIINWRECTGSWTVSMQK